MAMRRKPVEYRVGQDRWLVSYADFITLLFAFFTTMYAISTVDARKLSQVMDSMQAAFAKGDVPSAPRRIGTGTSPGPSSPKTQASGLPFYGNEEHALPVDQVRAQIEARLRKQIAQGLVAVELDPRGLVVSIREAGSFATGRAELSDIAQGALAEIAATLRDIGNFVRVEGHTDDVPIHTSQYASNWELSTARATNVVAFLLERSIPPARLSAAGYAEYHPRTPNDSEAARARNRRVDVVILNPITVHREEPGRPTAESVAAHPAPSH